MALFNKTGKTTTAPTKTQNPRTTASNEVCTIAKGTSIEGDFETSANIRLEGKIKGEVRCIGRLFMSEAGIVEGNAKVGTAAIQGSFTGDIYAEGVVHIHKTGRVEGKVTCESLIIDQGGMFNGQSHMRGIAAKK